jgi:hypothetical protein
VAARQVDVRSDHRVLVLVTSPMLSVPDLVAGPASMDEACTDHLP